MRDRRTEFAAHLPCERFAILCGHLPVQTFVALVPDNNDGNIVAVLDAVDLLLEALDSVKRIVLRDGVDDEEAVAFTYPLVSKGSVFLCAVEAPALSLA